MALCNGRINLYRYKPERSIYVSYSRPLLFPFTLYCLSFEMKIIVSIFIYGCVLLDNLFLFSFYNHNISYTNNAAPII